MGKDYTIEDLKNAEQGTIVAMGCRNCESFEDHKKVENDWVCQWCGHKE